MQKRISVYARQNSWFYATKSRATGMWFATGPFSVLSGSSTALEKGMEALKALAASREGIPPKKDLQDDSNMLPLYKLAGAKGWSGFARGTLNCSVEQSEERIEILSWKRDGRGYSPVTDGMIVLASDAGPQEIGEALEQAFKRCT